MINLVAKYMKIKMLPNMLNTVEHNDTYINEIKIEQ